jgi:hypothetical protein
VPAWVCDLRAALAEITKERELIHLVDVLEGPHWAARAFRRPLAVKIVGGRVLGGNHVADVARQLLAGTGQLDALEEGADNDEAIALETAGDAGPIEADSS